MDEDAGQLEQAPVQYSKSDLVQKKRILSLNKVRGLKPRLPQRKAGPGEFKTSDHLQIKRIRASIDAREKLKAANGQRIAFALGESGKMQT